MLSRIWRGRPSQDLAEVIYGQCVQHARSPVFYRELAVPDTLEGRFEIVVIAVFAVVYRLQQAGPGGEKRAQEVLETFFRTLDDDMREMGVGDLTVPRKVHSAASAFYGRSKAYAVALNDVAELSAAIARNLPGAASSPPPDAATLAGHLRAMIAALQVQSDADLLAGRLQLPDVPEAKSRGGGN